MENEFILAAAGIQPQAIPEIQSWQSSPVYPLFHANGRDASAFNPVLSSPVGSNPLFVSNDGFRELFRKLDGFGGNSEEITRSSCYSTPLSSPLNLGKSVAPSANSNLAEFAADPGFAERAARFSCFGNRSFNGRTGPYIGGRVEFHQAHSLESATAAGDVRLGQVSCSPSLNGLGQGPQPGIDIQGPLGQLDRIKLTESPEEQSSVIEPVPSGEAGPRNSGETNPRKRKGVANRGKAKEPAASASKAIQGSGNSNAKRCKSNVGDDRDKEEGDGEGEAEEKQNKGEEKALEPPKDYIHVRARRGQATDSHSLAERVRREKISERMKLLQDLVPGCNKVTGKALMLDEIINYVQSLQRQVEFLSMKLASVNTRLDVANADSLMSKDHHHRIFPSNNALPHPMFPGDTPPAAAADFWPLDSHIAPTPSILPYQGFSSGGDDLNTIVQMGLGQWVFS